MTKAQVCSVPLSPNSRCSLTLRQLNRQQEYWSQLRKNTGQVHHRLQTSCCSPQMKVQSIRQHPQSELLPQEISWDQGDCFYRHYYMYRIHSNKAFHKIIYKWALLFILINHQKPINTHLEVYSWLFMACNFKIWWVGAYRGGWLLVWIWVNIGLLALQKIKPVKFISGNLQSYKPDHINWTESDQCNCLLWLIRIENNYHYCNILYSPLIHIKQGFNIWPWVCALSKQVPCNLQICLSMLAPPTVNLILSY